MIKALVEFDRTTKALPHDFTRLPAIGEYVYQPDMVWIVTAVFHPLVPGQHPRIKVAIP